MYDFIYMDFLEKEEIQIIKISGFLGLGVGRGINFG